MDEIFKSLLAAGSLTVILFLILWVWFSKRLKSSLRRELEKEFAEHKAKLEHESQRNLSEYKANLDHEYDQKFAQHLERSRKSAEGEVARLNAELERRSGESNRSFSKVFDKTVEAVSDIHQTLLDLEESLEAYLTNYAMADAQTRTILKQLFKSRRKAFETALKRGRLYINKDTRESVHAVYAHLDAVEKKFTWFEGLVEANPNADTGHVFFKLTEMTDEIVAAVRSLEDAFQDNLGSAKKPPPA
jgi:hypothetical protein